MPSYNELVLPSNPGLDIGSPSQRWGTVYATNVDAASSSTVSWATPGAIGATTPNTSVFTRMDNIRYADAFATGSTTAGINEAIADFGAAPACGKIILPKGNKSITATINVNNRSGCILEGHGDGQTAPTRLTWAGAAGGTMLTAYGSDSIRIRNGYWDGANIAAIGIDFDSTGTATQQCEVGGNTFFRLTSEALHIGSATNKQVSEILVHDNVVQGGGIGTASGFVQEGSQTENIHYWRNSFFNWTGWAMDFLNGAADVVAVDLQPGAATTGGGIRVNPNCQAMKFDWIYGDGVQNNTTPFFKFTSGVRNYVTSMNNLYLNWQIAGGRIIDFQHTSSFSITNSQFANDGTGSGDIFVSNPGGGSGGTFSFKNNVIAAGNTLTASGFGQQIEDDPGTTSVWNSSLSGLALKSVHAALFGGGLTFGTAAGVKHFTIYDNSGVLAFALTGGTPGNQVFANTGPYGLERTDQAFNTGFYRAGDIANGYQLGNGANINKIVSTATTGTRTFTLPDADSNPVRPLTCPGGQHISAIAADGTITCS